MCHVYTNSLFSFNAFALRDFGLPHIGKIITEILVYHILEKIITIKNNDQLMSRSWFCDMSKCESTENHESRENKI